VVRCQCLIGGCPLIAGLGHAAISLLSVRSNPKEIYTLPFYPRAFPSHLRAKFQKALGLALRVAFAIDDGTAIGLGRSAIKFGEAA